MTDAIILTEAIGSENINQLVVCMRTPTSAMIPAMRAPGRMVNKRALGPGVILMGGGGICTSSRGRSGRILGERAKRIRRVGSTADFVFPMLIMSPFAYCSPNFAREKRTPSLEVLDLDYKNSKNLYIRSGLSVYR